MYTSHPVQSYTVYHDHTFTSPPFSSLLCSLLPCKRTRTRNLVQRRRHGKHETFTEFWTCSCPHPKSLPLNKSLNQHRRCGAFAFTFGLSFSPLRRCPRQLVNSVSGPPIPVSVPGFASQCARPLQSKRALVLKRLSPLTWMECTPLCICKADNPG